MWIRSMKCSLVQIGGLSVLPAPRMHSGRPESLHSYLPGLCQPSWTEPAGDSLLSGAGGCSFQLLAAGVRGHPHCPDPQVPAAVTQAWSPIPSLPFPGCGKVLEPPIRHL